MRVVTADLKDRTIAPSEPGFTCGELFGDTGKDGGEVGAGLAVVVTF